MESEKSVSVNSSESNLKPKNETIEKKVHNS